MRKSIFMLAVLALSAGYATSAAAADPQDADTRPDLALMRKDTTNALTNGFVKALAPHPDGGMIVGGEFVQVNGGTTRTHLLRVLPDGTLDAGFDVLIESNGAMEVNAIAVDGDAIYIGGMWQKVEGQERLALAKLDLDGNLVADWDAKLSTLDIVHALAVGGGKVYVGGGIVGYDAWGLARFDAQTAAHDPRWRAQTQTNATSTPSAGGRSQVHALFYTGNDIIVGGPFGQIAGVARKGVARLSLAPSDTDAQVLPYGVANFSGRVAAIARDATTGQIYLGGDFFTSRDGVSFNNLVRTDAAGTVDLGFKPAPRALVSALQLARGKLYYGGNFRVDVDTPLYLARTSVAGNGAPDPEWLPLPDAHVRALAWQDGEQRLWIGGEFTQIGNQERNGLARISFRGEFTIFRDGFED